MYCITCRNFNFCENMFSTATLLQDYIDQHFAEGVEETSVSIFSECAILHSSEFHNYSY